MNKTATILGFHKGYLKMILTRDNIIMLFGIANYFLFKYLFGLGDVFFREMFLPLMVALTMILIELITYMAFTRKLKIKIIFDSK
jgi:hypothetical protein